MSFLVYYNFFFKVNFKGFIYYQELLYFIFKGIMEREWYNENLQELYLNGIKIVKKYREYMRNVVSWLFFILFLYFQQIEIQDCYIVM